MKMGVCHHFAIFALVTSVVRINPLTTPLKRFVCAMRCQAEFIAFRVSLKSVTWGFLTVSVRNTQRYAGYFL